MGIELACTAPVPVPSTFLLFGSGMLVVIVYVWRRERNSKLNPKNGSWNMDST
jgi:hypothetical protein